MKEKIILNDLVEKAFKINKKKVLEILKFGFLNPDCKSICYNGLYNIVNSTNNGFKNVKIKKTLNLFGK